MYRVITVVTVLYNVPYVRNTVLVEVIVIALRGLESYNVVLSTACNEYKVRCLVLTAPLPSAGSTGSRADSAYIAELVAVLHAYLERLASAH